jgi:DNA processing protein
MRRIARHDEEYPAQLRELPSMPSLFYVRGMLVRDDALAVAVVGSRLATEYGKGMAEEIAAGLAARGVTIVSGLARGIDTAAHRGALRAGGRTIAVLGSGIDVIYPPENRALAARIEASGAVMSQFEPGVPPFPQHFPLRNQVIAGLALAVVVVEAAERSGALITARLAADFGREVMAVPGRAGSPSSRGAHALIRDGACLVENWEDVVAGLPDAWRACVSEPVETMSASPGDKQNVKAGRETEGVLSHVIGDEPMTIDDIIEKSGLSAGRVSALLLGLELEGRIRRLEGERFVQGGAAHVAARGRNN